MTIESMMRARLAARSTVAVVDFEDTAAPVVTNAHAGQEPQGDDLAAHEIGHEADARPVAVSAQDDVALPSDWQIPPRGVKRRKGKGAK